MHDAQLLDFFDVSGGLFLSSKLYNSHHCRGPSTLVVTNDASCSLAEENGVFGLVDDLVERVAAAAPVEVGAGISAADSRGDL